MSRQDIRTGIAEYFGGTTYDATTGYYRPTLLAANGLAGVKAYYSTRITDQDYLAGLDPDRLMGAVMCVHLAESTEKRLSMGILDRPFAVDLYVWHMSVKPPSEDAQADLDDLITAVIDRIRADATLGGVVVQAGETERGITVSVPAPYTEPPALTKGSATISFNANTYPSG